jgi:hypothetical protein
MASQCPYLCVISQVIPHSEGAGSILLLRLLETWPQDRLAVYGPPVPSRATVLSCGYHQFQPSVQRIQFSRFAPLAPLLSLLLPPGLSSLDLPRDALVLSVMQSSMYYRAAWAVARRNSLPLALIIYDDPEEIESVRWWTKPFVRHFNRQVYAAAKVRFCVSPQMSVALERRYGVKGEVLYPNRCRRIVARPLELTSHLRRQNGFVLGYVGNLAYGYGEGLEQLLPVFRKQGIILRIYSLHAPRFADRTSVEYAGQQDLDELWSHVQKECDAVILSYSGPEHGHEKLYRTHFPSKLPEYLALGMPVLISGPSYATGVQWGLDHPHSCVVVRSESPDEWDRTLRRLVNDQDYRCALAQGAVAASNGELAPERIESSFRSRLNDAAKEMVAR